MTSLLLVLTSDRFECSVAPLHSLSTKPALTAILYRSGKLATQKQEPNCDEELALILASRKARREP
jgi:hypothetical protein